MTIDTATNAMMQSIENPATTVITKIISIIFDPITILVIALAISIYLLFKSQKKQGIILAVIIMITAIIIKFSKQILQVARPLNSIIPETSFSFPSGHATINVVFLGLITYIFTKNKTNKTKIIAALSTTLIILVINFSRIYLRVHWLTDILAGLVLGSIILIITIQFSNKLIPSPAIPPKSLSSLSEQSKSTPATN